MRNIYVVSHTHWDLEWYRSFQSFRLKLVHLVDGLLELLDKDPHFKTFMLDGQTIVLDDYLEIRPERATTLKRLIGEGRLLVGSDSEIANSVPLANFLAFREAVLSYAV